VSQTVHPVANGQDGGWWQRLVRGACQLFARSDWSQFAGDDWPEHIMQAKITDDFHAKQGRTTARWALSAGDNQLVVYLKRHYQLPRHHGLLAALWRGNWSPAMQEFHNLLWAKSKGLPVPNVVAAGEFLGPWGKLQSFLAIEELSNMIPLHEAIPLAAKRLDSKTFQTWKAGLVRELARLTRFLHDHQFFHKDLYLCHFFIDRADINGVASWTNRVFMIDFHRLARHTLTRPFWLTKDLGQLLFSSDVEGVNGRDRLRFWRAYTGSRRDSFLNRWLGRIIQMRGRRYREHNAKAAASARERLAA
jgi:heptose I phosphotransferase